MTDELARVRELHRPLWHDPLTHVGERQVWLVCRGCDEGDHAEGPPAWPCRTAEIVYGAGEIASREPQVPGCPENHRAQAVFMRAEHGTVTARRWKCSHVQPVPVESGDSWE